MIAFLEVDYSVIRKIVIGIISLLMILTFLAPVYAAEAKTVIVLDPGHGGKDDGASSLYTNEKEKTINLKIAQYIKEELSKYVNVEVYLTRNDDTYISLDDRCLFAKNVNADLFISLHNNIDEKHSSNGSEIYVSYKNEHNARMSDLSNLIMAQFRMIGLKDNGIKTRVKIDNKTIDNISAGEITQNTRDYYAIIRGCTSYGIDSMIVEHCYMDSWNDYLNHFSNDEQIKAMAQCDAKAITEYYGLLEKLDSPVFSFDATIFRKIFSI